MTISSPTPSSWHIAAGRTSYAIALDDDGRLRLLHWGRSISDADVARMAARPDDVFVLASTYTPRVTDELSFPDGVDQRIPTVSAEFASGSRGLRLAVSDTWWDETTLRISLVDFAQGFEVVLWYRAESGSEVIERWAELSNLSSAPVAVVTAHSCALALPRRVRRVSYLAGRWAADPRWTQSELPEGRFELAESGGYAGHRAKPWFAVDDGNATEDDGEVWSASLAWSGSWRLAIERTVHEGWHAVMGMAQADFRYTLDAGERLTLPAVALVHSREGFGGMSRRWHDYQRESVLRDTLPRPVLFNSWEATMFDIDEGGQMDLAARAAEIGCELFVVDDGWFRGREDETGGLGDWEPDPAKFPRGLRPLAEEVRSLGMDFGLWIEPEMVSPGSDLMREHPDWVYAFPGLDHVTMRHQLVLNLARADVREHVWQTIDRLLREVSISYLKWDFNRPITQAGWAGHPNAQRVWIDHVRALYTILDRLRAEHPAVRIEACAGGGGRTDLGMLAHVDQVWTSDDTDPYDRLALQHGFTHGFAPNAMSSWVTASPSLLNNRQSSLTYRFHVAMCGVLGIGDDIRAWTAEETAVATKLILWYKANRDTIQNGTVSRLAFSPELTAVQYESADRETVVVFAFGHARRFATRAEKIRLKVSDEAGLYLDEHGRPFGGSELNAVGLGVELSGDLDSTVTRLRKVS